MKKIAALFALFTQLFAGNTYADLLPGSLLQFQGAPLVSDMIQPAIGTGSWFSVRTSPTTHVYTSITAHDGLYIGLAQPASGSHQGFPDGSESPGIDEAWNFFSNTGMHHTTSPINIISQSSNTALLDFSAWSAIWNSMTIELGTGAFGDFTDGVAVLTCAIDCSNVGATPENPSPEAWTLDYTATVIDGAFMGVEYRLHLESSPVPVPAALWLFISGIAGLVAVSRRRIQN